jgi:hypothetical protein
MNATPSPPTLIEARADYRMCIEEGFLAASPIAWRTFLVSYLAQERARAIRRNVRRADAGRNLCLPQSGATAA